jgi:hypothetical protein
MKAKTGADRVEDDVAAQLDQMPVAFHEDGVEPSLKKVTVDLVPSVEPLGVEAVQAVHTH